MLTECCASAKKWYYVQVGVCEYKIALSKEIPFEYECLWLIPTIILYFLVVLRTKLILDFLEISRAFTVVTVFK